MAVLSLSRPTMMRRFGVVPAVAWVATVAAVSAVASGGSGWVVALAASPERIREGKFWFLFSSALLVDRPVFVSVACFVALAALGWIVCSERVFWLSALLGQVAATLVVYLFIGTARWLVAGAFSAAVASPDYGVSTVSAAWLGSIATVAWRARGRGRRGKVSIVISCIAVGLFAYSLRPDLTVLSSEHLVAFALGVGIAVPGLARNLFSLCVQRPVGRAAATLTGLGVREANRAAAVTLTAVLALIAVVAAPAALGTLRHEIALHLPPTETRCEADWNRLATAPRSVLHDQTHTYLSVTVTHIEPVAASISHPRKREPRQSYCRYTLTDRNHAIVVLGRWRNGRVRRWTVATAPRSSLTAPGNATLDANRRIHLDRLHAHLTLSS